MKIKAGLYQVKTKNGSIYDYVAMSEEDAINTVINNTMHKGSMAVVRTKNITDVFITPMTHAYVIEGEENVSQDAGLSCEVIKFCIG